MKKVENAADSLAVETEGFSGTAFGDPTAWSWGERLSLGATLLRQRPFRSLGVVLALALALHAWMPLSGWVEPSWRIRIAAFAAVALLLSIFAARWGVEVLFGEESLVPGPSGWLLAVLGGGALTLVLAGSCLLLLLLPAFLVSPEDGVLLLLVTEVGLAVLCYRLGAFAVPHLAIAGASPQEGTSVSWQLTGSWSEGWGFPGLLFLGVAAACLGLEGLGASLGGPGGFVVGRIGISLLLLWAHLVWVVQFLHLRAVSRLEVEGFLTRIGILDLVVAGVIYAVLLASSVPNFSTGHRRNPARSCFANQKTIAGAVEMYELDFNRTLPQLDDETRRLLVGNYLQRFPDDPDAGPGSAWHYVLVPESGNRVTCIWHGPIQNPERRSPREILEAGGITDSKLLAAAAEDLHGGPKPVLRASWGVLGGLGLAGLALSGANPLLVPVFLHRFWRDHLAVRRHLRRSFAR